MNKKDKKQIISEVLKVLTDPEIKKEYSRITGEKFTNKVKEDDEVNEVVNG